MPRRSALRITKRTVDALCVADKDTVFWDRDLAGFGVRTHATGRKVYVVQTRGPHRAEASHPRTPWRVLHRGSAQTGGHSYRLHQAGRGAGARGGVSPSAVAALRLLMLTGCRKSEILTPRWEHVALEAGELRLPDSKTGARVVPLSPSAVKVLDALPRAPGNPWVIPRRQTGTHMRALGDAWEVIRTRADLEDVRIHDVRRSFASRALALGESLPMIGKLLGHSQKETTSRYAHLARDSAHQSAARIADSLATEILGDDWRSHLQ